MNVMHNLQFFHSISVGYGRNRAIEASKGNYLCFQDIDDEMMPERITKQYALAKQHKNAVNIYFLSF